MNRLRYTFIAVTVVTAIHQYRTQPADESLVRTIILTIVLWSIYWIIKGVVKLISKTRRAVGR